MWTKKKEITILENKILNLKEELSKEKELNLFLSNYIEEGKNYPIIFSDQLQSYYFGQWKNVTEIKYLHQNKIHTIITPYLGDNTKFKIIKNEKNYFIFEDAIGLKWIVNKEKEVITELPKDMILSEDLVGEEI